MLWNWSRLLRINIKLKLKVRWKSEDTYLNCMNYICRKISIDLHNMTVCKQACKLRQLDRCQRNIFDESNDKVDVYCCILFILSMSQVCKIFQIFKYKKIESAWIYINQVTILWCNCKYMILLMKWKYKLRHHNFSVSFTITIPWLYLLLFIYPPSRTLPGWHPFRQGTGAMLDCHRSKIRSKSRTSHKSDVGTSL